MPEEPDTRLEVGDVFTIEADGTEWWTKPPFNWPAEQKWKVAAVHEHGYKIERATD